MKLVVVVLSLVTLSAHAADNPKYKQFYLVNGSKSSAEEAILASLKGAEAFRCQSVEAKVSKSGTSIGVRNIKKKIE